MGSSVSSLHRPSPPRGIPHSFYPFLLIFHAFPLHAVLTLFVLDAPFGRFARVGSRLNLNGTCLATTHPTSLQLVDLRGGDG
jgi:hypothetical protein